MIYLDYFTESFKNPWKGCAIMVLTLRCLVVQSCLTLCDPTDCSTQASLSFTVSLSLLRLVSTEPVMPCDQLIPCRPLLLLPSVFPSIRGFSKEPALRTRWPEDRLGTGVLEARALGSVLAAGLPRPVSP